MKDLKPKAFTCLFKIQRKEYLGVCGMLCVSFWMLRPGMAPREGPAINVLTVSAVLL